MILSIEQNKKGKWYSILSTFVSDLQKQHYENIYKLYTVANMDTEEIINVTKQTRMMGKSVSEQIFLDIAYALASHIMVDGKLNAIFKDIYSRIFPFVQKSFDKIILSYYQKEDERKKISFKINEGQFFFKYLIYDAEILLDANDNWFGINYYEDEYKCHEYFETKEFDYVNSQINLICFHGTTEKVFESSLYQKYIRKNRIRIAEHLKIQEPDIAQYFHNSIRIMSSGEWCDGKIGIINNSIVELMLDRNCSQLWLFNIIDGLTNPAYYPNVDKLIELYYRSFVISKYLDNQKRKQPFTKITLSRECKEDIVESDIRNIIYLYHVDLILELFLICLGNSYRNFSWENIAQKKTISYYRSLVEDLSEEIFEQSITIEKLTEAKNVLEAKNISDINSQNYVFEKEIQRLNRKITQQQLEINRLKQTIHTFEELDNLKTTISEEPILDVDIPFLQSKRYLFVGSTEGSLSGLRELFPNSIFMESSTFDLQGLKCDAVIMLVKKMSHSMYYKAKFSHLKNQVPIIMCNGTSQSSVLFDMYSHFSSMLEDL